MRARRRCRRAPPGAAGHRRRERRDPRRRHPRLRGQRRLRRRHARPPAGTSASTSSRSPTSARPTLEQLTPVSATYPTGAFTGSGPGDVTGTVIPVDIQLGLEHQHQRLRGGRLRRLPRREHRPHPARHLHVRRQGRQRRRPPARRASSSSTRATPARPPGLIVGTLGGPARRRHPRGRRELRAGRRAGRRPGSTAQVFVPAPEQRRRRTSSPSCPAPTTTTS